MPDDAITSVPLIGQIGAAAIGAAIVLPALRPLIVVGCLGTGH